MDIDDISAELSKPAFSTDNRKRRANDDDGGGRLKRPRREYGDTMTLTIFEHVSTDLGRYYQPQIFTVHKQALTNSGSAQISTLAVSGLRDAIFRLQRPTVRVEHFRLYFDWLYVNDIELEALLENEEDLAQMSSRPAKIGKLLQTLCKLLLLAKQLKDALFAKSIVIRLLDLRDDASDAHVGLNLQEVIDLWGGLYTTEIREWLPRWLGSRLQRSDLVENQSGLPDDLIDAFWDLLPGHFTFHVSLDHLPLSLTLPESVRVDATRTLLSRSDRLLRATQGPQNEGGAWHVDLEDHTIDAFKNYLDSVNFGTIDLERILNVPFIGEEGDRIPVQTEDMCTLVHRLCQLWHLADYLEDETTTNAAMRHLINLDHKHNAPVTMKSVKFIIQKLPTTSALRRWFVDRVIPRLDPEDDIIRKLPYDFLAELVINYAEIYQNEHTQQVRTSHIPSIQDFHRYRAG